MQVEGAHARELEDPTPYLSGGELVLTTGLVAGLAALLDSDEPDGELLRTLRHSSTTTDRGSAGGPYQPLVRTSSRRSTK